MQFNFLLNIAASKIESDDANFFLAVESNRNSLLHLKPYELFPDREFYQSIVSKFKTGLEETIHFYNYLYTSEGRRIRVSGKASRTTEGFLFECKREKLKDATITEIERKNSLLHAINQSAELFLQNINWENVISESLVQLLKAGDFSYANLWQIGLKRNEEHFLYLRTSTEGVKNAHVNISHEFSEYFSILKNRETVISYSPVMLLKTPNKYYTQLFLPLYVHEVLWGILEFGQLNHKKWDSDEIVSLESYSKILASAIRSYSYHKKLKETEKKLNVITETTDSVLYSKKMNKSYDYISPSAKNLFNAELNKIHRFGIEHFINDELNSKLVFEKPDHKIYAIQKDDGGTKYLCDKKFEWRNDKGELQGHIGIVQDVTERMIHEEELKRNNEILNSLSYFTQKVFNKKSADDDLHALLKYLGEVTKVDRIYLFTKKNDKLEFSLEAFWFNISEVEVQNAGIFDLDFDPEENAELLQTLETGKRYNSTDAENFPNSVSSVILPIFKNGSFYGFIGFDNFKNARQWSSTELDALDIASRVIGASLELGDFITELIAAKREAQKSDRLKSEFIAQISHEIRSPLNVVLSFLGILWEEMRQNRNNGLTEVYDTINKASKRLIRTIDLLIEASEIQSGTYDAEYDKINLVEDILHPVYLVYKIKAEEKGLRISRKSDSTEKEVIGDFRSLHSAIDNLISNAIKYTDKGNIRIIDYNKDDKLIIEIEDTGKGMSRAYMTKMFFPFTQEEEGYTRGHEGVGLGMYIVKKYCDLNDIQLYVESEQGKGSKFTLEFPIAKLSMGNSLKKINKS